MEFSKCTSSLHFNAFTTHVWKTLDEGCKKNFACRFLVIPAVLATSTADVLKNIAAIAQTSIQGAAHLTAFPFKEEAHFWQGVEKLTIELPGHAISLGLTPLYTLGRLLIQPGAVLVFGSKGATFFHNYYYSYCVAQEAKANIPSAQ